VEEKLFGPVHDQLVAAPPDSVRFKVAPAQMGALLPAVSVGVAFTVTEIVVAVVQELPSVMVTL
jgi:hypothetical protein